MTRAKPSQTAFDILYIAALVAIGLWGWYIIDTVMGLGG